MPKRVSDEAAKIYAAAEVFREQALGRDGSMFSPGESVWTLSTVNDLRDRFVLRPDTSKGKSFDEKFEQQLSGAPRLTVLLAAELFYVHLLISTKVSGAKKRQLINGVLALGQLDIRIPTVLDLALDGGIAATGQAFNQNRPFLLIYLVEFARAWKALDATAREAALTDPWSFKRVAFSVQVPKSQTQQHALLHLVHPNTFEPTVSLRHKNLIAEHFASAVSSNTVDIDEKLRQVRAALTPQFGEDFSFYSQELKPQWLPEETEETEQAAGELPGPPIEAGPRVWVEKCLRVGRPDRESGPHAVGRALWSPQKSEDGRDYYRAMREIKPGDLVLHLVDNKAMIGVSKAQAPADDSFVGLEGTTWANRPALRVPLEGFALLEPPLPREWLFDDPDVRRRLEAVVADHRGLFFSKNLELNQGAYLTEAPPVLAALLNGVYERHTGHALPHLGDVETAADDDDTVADSAGSLSLSWLSEQTLWTEERLQDVIDTLRSSMPQVILAGPPGTGKTWVAELIARFLTHDQPSRRRLVQFHPSYTYEAFIEGLRPVVENGVIQFRPAAGVVLDMAKQIGLNREPHVLVIDELNRANLPKVLGELMYLFEYRNRRIDLPFQKDFTLPANLWFIGTMNTADRNIRSIDLALRRRFDVFECPPDVGALRRYYERHENLVDSLFAGFEAMNSALEAALDRHHTIGHTFFMADPMTPSRLVKIWNRKIRPLLEEYFFDQPAEVHKFEPTLFWPELA